MAFKKFTADLNVIQKLSNLPNETDGLSADALKAAFDEAGVTTQEFINEHIAELESVYGADFIGIQTIEGVNADNIQTALEILKGQINDATAGAIPDNSIDNSKLKDNTVQNGKIADGAIDTRTLEDGAVTDDKIVSVAASKVTGLEIDGNALADNAVSTDKIADFNVTERKLGGGSVTEPKLGSGAVTAPKIANGAVSQTYTAIIGTTWSGDAAPYTQTISVTGVIADDKPIVGVVYSEDFETAEAQKGAWANIYRIKTEAGQIVVYASDPTETEIPIQMTCVRK